MTEYRWFALERAMWLLALALSVIVYFGAMVTSRWGIMGAALCIAIICRVEERGVASQMAWMRGEEQ